jgi:hypothetical protein
MVKSPPDKMNGDSRQRKEYKRIFFEKTRKSVGAIRLEFRRQTSMATTGAFGFLIGLSWRDPIQTVVDSIISRFGFGQQLIYRFLSAIVITVISVLALILIARWAAEPKTS